MFAGHYAAALAAKRAAPNTSLGTLVFAAQFLDLLWPPLLLLNVEQVRIAPGITRVTPLDFYHYPYSHSLLAALGWAAALAITSFLLRHSVRTALVLGGLVASHWFLDALVHRPDLPLTPWGDSRIGLGLWNSLPLTLILECFLFVAGMRIYMRTTEARNWKGRAGFGAFVVVLFAIYLASLLGPPPPNVTAVALAGLALWLTVLWAWWVDRHRMVSSHIR